MYKRLKVSVQLSELHQQHLTVPAWELPILTAVHGQAKISVNGEELDKRESPSAEVEFERLQKRYGNMENSDGAKGLFYADAVFGQFGVGTATLAKAITEATVQPAADLIGDVDPVSSVGG
jgi:hypothetical protein